MICYKLVAPYLGAWIEIESTIIKYGKKITSLPTWERGLKSNCRSGRAQVCKSLPTWERGLKLGWGSSSGGDISRRSLLGSVD